MHNTTEIEKSLEDYPLIPMDDIEDEARLLAVRWVENYGTMGFDIQNRHKLASDIINYAIRHHEKQYKEVKRLRTALEKIYTMQLNSPAEAEGRFYDCIDIVEEALNKK